MPEGSRTHNDTFTFSEPLGEDGVCVCGGGVNVPGGFSCAKIFRARYLSENHELEVIFKASQNSGYT